MDSFFIHNNGQSIPIYIVLIPTIVEGKVTGAFGIIKDKSEARKIENSLMESESKFKAIVEEALLGVYILKDGHLYMVIHTFINYSELSTLTSISVLLIMFILMI